MGRRGSTLWLTGLPGSGKTTLARHVRTLLVSAGAQVEILDGDEIRRDLSFSDSYTKADRDANVRRIGFVARLLARNGIIAIAATISPYRAIRDEIRRLHETAFVEVFVDCPLAELLRRDPKGLYARALRGELNNLTGISDPYECPTSPELVVRTDVEDVNDAAQRIVDWLVAHDVVPGSARTFHGGFRREA